MRSEDLVRVKSVVKLLAGSDTVVLETVRVSTIAEIWNAISLFGCFNSVPSYETVNVIRTIKFWCLGCIDDVVVASPWNLEELRTLGRKVRPRISAWYQLYVKPTRVNLILPDLPGEWNVTQSP